MGHGRSLWFAPEPFLCELAKLKVQAEHIEYAWLCSRSETAILVHVF